MNRPTAPVAILALAALAACAAPAERSTTFGGIPAAAPEVPAIYSRSSPPMATTSIESTPTGAELAFVLTILSELQLRSFAENREFCGYIGLDPEGTLLATPVMAGTEAMCPLPRVPPTMRLVASFHTHGTYSPYYASEWPTTQDMATDARDDIDGYIATPGGRLWHVDTDTMTVRQVCGRGCLPQDPNYVAADDGPVRPLMSYGQLAAWERS